ncbi:MAG: glycosyltransferase family 4 protein [Nanoarchaeota archaeon]
MTKKICFFSAGFAFNRLNRMRFYEKALPKDTEIYLFTTDRWHDKEDSYQFEWSGLKRTKIFVAKYNSTLPLQLRKFCRDNKIDTLVNIGNRASIALFLFASLFSKTRYIFNMMGWVPKGREMIKDKIPREIWDYLFFYIFLIFANKVASVDNGVYQRFIGKNKPLFFRLFNKKAVYLPAPVDTDLFYLKDKKSARKKLGLPLNKKIVIFVGRINPNKCGDILVELIKRNRNILFVVIGRSLLKEFDNLKAKNLIYFNKKNPEELVDYYNAADISFLLMRLRASGLGQTTEESLACGLPAISREMEGVDKTPALIQIPPQKIIYTKLIYDFSYGVKESEKALKKYFKKSKKERLEISKAAREYALKNYSHKVWAEPHTKAYLE